MRLVFADERVHRLSADSTHAAAFWGTRWTTLMFCMALLLDSVDFASLRAWQALDIRITAGLVHVAHHDAVVTLVPLTPDGTALEIHEGEAVNNLDTVNAAQVIDVACAGKHAATPRSR